MTKTISEVQGTIGKNKVGKKAQKDLDKDIKSTLLSASILMKDVMSSSHPGRMQLCLDLKRRLEVVEKEYGVTLI